MARNFTNGRVLRLFAAASILAVLITAPVGAQASPIPPPSCGSIGQCIANQAAYELTDNAHNTEHPDGSNCNFYSTQWHDAGASRCSNGQYAEAWCMDFVHYVYQHEGASVSGLGSLPHLASSAKLYGEYHGTWSSTPHIGAMALLYTNEHVEIVVSINPTAHTVGTISGNWSNVVYHKTGQPWGNYLGFAGAVAG